MGCGSPGSWFHDKILLIGINIVDGVAMVEPRPLCDCVHGRCTLRIKTQRIIWAVYSIIVPLCALLARARFVQHPCYIYVFYPSHFLRLVTYFSHNIFGKGGVRACACEQRRCFSFIFFNPTPFPTFAAPFPLIFFEGVDFLLSVGLCRYFSDLFLPSRLRTLPDW